MTSSEIRQSFLDFFKSKQHTIVPSSSLMSDSPNLLFTNAGMNQFVPIFLGQVKCPYNPPRAADTQKCIRAGGKHNDLDDVGLDTYHHTFFEMLGNWSFGDYFKKEAIEWAWELVTEVWKFPKDRLYATVYSPDKSQGDPSDFDQEAYDYWAAKFTAAGLDPKIHIVYGNKKDNFWMMGETGPCGPCSELHVDLTPAGDTKGSLVNKGDARCIEIWNLVFIQFNANADGTFSPLPAKHVDTGMGFERASSIIQCTRNFTDFTGIISNYETDIFRPIFDALEKLSGKKYCSTLPSSGTGSATVPVAPVGVSPTGSSSAGGATYYKRRLPHFERPWAKYMVSFSTHDRKKLSPQARDIVLKSLLFGHEHRRYQLFAACVMPDHVHFLFEPQIKEQDKDGKPIFWPLTEILHSIKSFTAHEINKIEKSGGQIWENESFDRMIRGDADLEEKFHYICRNPWDSGVVPVTENYPWLWTPDFSGSAKAVETGSATVPVASVGVSPTERSAEVQQIPGNTTVQVPSGGARTSSGMGSATVPVASVGVSPTESSAGVERNPDAARDAQQSDRDGRAPQNTTPHSSEQIQIDVAFRVIADHIRTLSFAIADGIQPGNTDRNYVLRRILRRAVRYGRTLGFHEPFFYKLVDVLADTMGNVFPDIRAKKQHVQEVIRNEEEAFNKTLDEGIEIFDLVLRRARELADSAVQIAKYRDELSSNWALAWKQGVPLKDFIHVNSNSIKILEGLSRDISHLDFLKFFGGQILGLQRISNEFRQVSPTIYELIYGDDIIARDKFNLALEEMGKALIEIQGQASSFPGRAAFVLYDTYGFPLDLTELMARERGLTVDKEGFDRLMEEQKKRSQAAQKKEVISLSQIETTTPTKFVGFESGCEEATVLEVIGIKDKTAIVLDISPFYAEMGGQVGDSGWLIVENYKLRDTGGRGVDSNVPQYGITVGNTQKSGNTWLHFLDLDEDHEKDAPAVGTKLTAQIDLNRRNAIQRHHTVTHLLHWALHEVVSKEASQKGSFVGRDKLTFDFNSAALTPAQLSDIEKLVNERILENAGVFWTEVPYADVKSRKDVMQFFGDKYGDKVRVVQIGGGAGELNGYSMELCGGTHTRATGEIGSFRIVSESAVAAGVRRIEAVAGLQAYQKTKHDAELIGSVASKVNAPVIELEKKIEALLAHQKQLEKSLQAAKQKEAAGDAKTLLAKAETINGIPAIIANISNAEGDTLQTIADALKSQFKGVIVLGGAASGAVSLVAAVSPDFTAKVRAGKIIQAIAPIVGGKGGGKPDNARGGGKDTAKLDEALAKAKSLLG